MNGLKSASFDPLFYGIGSPQLPEKIDYLAHGRIMAIFDYAAMPGSWFFDPLPRRGPAFYFVQGSVNSLEAVP